MELLNRPSLEQADEFLRTWLPALGPSSRALLLVGRCHVDYEGRASSELGEGDCIVIVKPDGSLLVHNPVGFKPVNWQPPGCTYAHRRLDEELVVEATRSTPRERVRISFKNIEFVSVPQLRATAAFDLRGTEFDLRDTLRACPDLVEPGFQPWAAERMTERGPLDLYGEDAQGRRVIVEVKRTRSGLAEATQLWRYVEKERGKRGVEVRGILMAPACSERARALLHEHGLEFKELDWPTLRPTTERLLGPNQPTLLSYGTPHVQTKKD